MKFQQIKRAELVLPCLDLTANIDFFKEQLGFKIVVIFPADDPSVCVMTGYGMQIRLKRVMKIETTPSSISLLCNNLEETKKLTAPNGCKIEFVDANPPLLIPPLQKKFVLSKITDGAAWINGRAGMRYRDLIPDRLGGRFIASHIHIPTAGPVPDYIHYHKVRFQMIYCYKGWVRLVYEDQGEEFIFKAGDCVLQPPQIRHRVLESSKDLEVIEIGCPAEHETFQDHEMALPNNQVDLGKQYGGQFFVRHIADQATWGAWRIDGFECRDTGIGEASLGLASAKVIRPKAKKSSPFMEHDAEFVFLFVLNGKMSLNCNQKENALTAGDAFVVPANMKHAFESCSADLELLEVTLPYKFNTSIN